MATAAIANYVVLAISIALTATTLEEELCVPGRPLLALRVANDVRLNAQQRAQFSGWPPSLQQHVFIVRPGSGTLIKSVTVGNMFKDKVHRSVPSCFAGGWYGPLLPFCGLVQFEL